LEVKEENKPQGNIAKKNLGGAEKGSFLEKTSGGSAFGGSFQNLFLRGNMGSQGKGGQTRAQLNFYAQCSNHWGYGF